MTQIVLAYTKLTHSKIKNLIKLIAIVFVTRYSDDTQLSFV